METLNKTEDYNISYIGERPKFWSALLFMLILTASFGLMFHTSVYQHEVAHQQIFAGYGIPSEIVYYYLPSTFNLTKLLESNMASTVYDGALYNERCTVECQLANDFNEAIGYNMSTIFMSLLILFVLYLLSKSIFGRTKQMILIKQIAKPAGQQPLTKSVQISPLNEQEEKARRAILETKQRYFIK